jgi:hypothetical protein
MNRVKFLNLLQLKIIEEHYGVSSRYEPEAFHGAFMEFVERKGPQTLRKVFDNWEHRVQYYVEKRHNYTHNELCEIKKELEKYEEIKVL